MINNKLNKTILPMLVALANISTLFASVPARNTTIKIEYVKNNNLKEEKELFIRSFKDAYKDIPLDILATNNLDFLEESFDKALMNLNNPNKKVFCAIAKNEGIVVGMIMFELTENDNEVCIGQLAVDPSAQKKELESN